MTKLEYGAQVKLVQTTIKNISDMGINVNSFMSKLNEIKEKANVKILEIKSNDSNTDTQKNTLIGTVYSYAYSELQTLLDYLSRYNLYFQTINKSQYLFNSQDEVQYNKIDLSNSIDELILCLESVKSFSGLNDEEDDLLIDSLYKVVYNLIKLECKSKGTSKLLAYCKKNKIDSIYINKYIIDDIGALRNDNYDIHDIDLLIYKLNSNGKDNMYLDDELMRMISICTNKEKYVKDLTEALEKLVGRIEEHNNRVKQINSEKQALLREEKGYRDDIRSEKSRKTKYIVTDIFTTAFSLAFLASAIYFIPGLSYDKTYNTDTETYSTSKGYNSKKDEYLDRLTYGGNYTDSYTQVAVYGPWEEQKFLGDKTYEREVKVLDLTDIELDSLEAYVNFDAEALGYKYDVDEESKDMLSLEDLYTTPITEVTKVTQDTEDIKTSEGPDFGNMVLMFMAAGAIYGLLHLLFRGLIEIPFGVYYSIKDLVETLEDSPSVDRDKRNLSEVLSKMKKINEEIEKAKQNPSAFESEYKKIMSIPENEKMLNQFQKSIDLLEQYASEIEISKKLTL